MRQYVLKEYGGLIGTDGANHQKLQNEKYYQNHLKALEIQKEEEEKERADIKVRIMQTAALMQYDDDFDEEELYAGKDKAKTKYSVRLNENKSPQKKKEDLPEEVFEGISEIKDPYENEDEEDDDDDMLDTMARFVEGQDIELIKDHSNTFDDEKLTQRKQMEQKKKEENSAKRK